MQARDHLGHSQIISLVFTLITFAFSLLPKTLTYGPTSSYVNHRLDMRQCVLTGADKCAMTDLCFAFAVNGLSLSPQASQPSACLPLLVGSDARAILANRSELTVHHPI
jgi:hypothetical protein